MVTDERVPDAADHRTDQRWRRDVPRVGREGLGSLRAGARARERETLAELIRSRNDAEADRDFWRDTAAGYRWQLRDAGVEPDPAKPVQPSERRATR